MKISRNKWLVVNKNYKTEDNHSHIPSFVRVRIVDLVDETYLTCTCGGCQKFVMPCEHVFSVFMLQDIEISVENVHIRWWNVYAYQTGLDENLKKKLIQEKHFFKHDAY